MYSAPSGYPRFSAAIETCANPILQPLHRLIVAFSDFRFDVGVFSFGEQSVVNCCDKRSAQKQMTKDFHEEYFCAVADCGQVLHRTPVEFS